MANYHKRNSIRTKHEPSTEHEDIAIIDGILFGRY